MAKFERNDEYDGNVQTLSRFLGRAGESGYTFASAKHEGLIPAITSELVELARKRGKKIQHIEYEDPEDNDLTFAEQLRRAAPDAAALIVTGLDRPMRERPFFIDALNFSREAFHEIGKPILFWLSQESIAFIGNRAVDFYTQRSMMTVEFENTPEITAPALELERRFRDEEYRSKEGYEALKTRVNLLKKQMAEAQEAEVPRRRIAQDIALPLAKTYSEQDLHTEALGLLEQFQEDWDEADARELYERGKILSGGKRQKEAIDCLEKARGLLDAGADLELLADVEIGIGDTLSELGQLDTALGHYEQNLVLREKILEKNREGEEEKKDFATSYNRLGGIYETQGKLGKAQEFFEKDLQIREVLHAANPLSENLKDGLGVSYNRLGGMYETQGKLGKALEFFEKSLQISEALHAANPLSENLKNELAVSYNRLGGIYKTQGKLGKALEFFEKNLQIREELHAANPLSERLKNNLATSYNRLCSIHERQGNWRKSIFYGWKEVVSEWHLCRYVGWRRYKQRAFDSTLSFIFTLILPPPIPTILFWVDDRFNLLGKWLRYGREQ
ncbi:MAG: tetratricopeptide repeat protein [Saprospiraceae bacterium]